MGNLYSKTFYYQKVTYGCFFLKFNVKHKNISVPFFLSRKFLDEVHVLLLPIFS